MLKTYVFRIGFFCWMVLITALSLVSFEDVSIVELEIPFLDKIVHFTFYFTASILGALGGWELNKIGKRSKFIILRNLFFGLLLYGIIIEVLQSSMASHRSGDFMDVLANTLGLVIGTWLMNVVFSKSSRLKWGN